MAVVLEELGLKYESKYLEFGDGEAGVKGAEHIKHNPNGRKSLLDTSIGGCTELNYVRYSDDHRS